MDVEDLSKFGRMAHLKHFTLAHWGPGDLHSFLTPLLDAAETDGTSVYSHQLESLDCSDAHLGRDDVESLLRLLKLPGCRLKSLGVGRSEAMGWEFTCQEIKVPDQLSLHPLKALVETVRYHNVSLVEFPVGINVSRCASIGFWVRMNRACPNRIKLGRKPGLVFALASEISNVLEKDPYSASIVFELVRSTHQHWASGLAGNPK
uniref:Uncharacterized protein n=1 Tax=Grammatophora oceanica TaxID=210454 RepID=A0A7S1VC42_9STRA